MRRLGGEGRGRPRGEAGLEVWTEQLASEAWLYLPLLMVVALAVTRNKWAHMIITVLFFLGIIGGLISDVPTW